MQKSFVSLLAGVAALTLSACVTPGSASKTVELRVGQTHHLTAYRGNSCSAPAPSYEAIVARLPKISVAKYSDGGLSSRVSKDCRKRVPTRAVNVTGVSAGTEAKQYQSESVAIVVR
jgi:hypothetical protein